MIIRPNQALLRYIIANFGFGPKKNRIRWTTWENLASIDHALTQAKSKLLAIEKKYKRMNGGDDGKTTKYAPTK